MSAQGHSRRAADGRGRPLPWVQWVREAVTIVAAAGAAYMGIRVDLARNQQDIENLKIHVVRVESQVDRVIDYRLSQGAQK